MNSLLPFYISSPGDTIKSLLDKNNFTRENLSLFLNKDKDYIESLLSGNISLTSETCDTLANMFETSATFWKDRNRIYFEKRGLLNEKLEAEWSRNFPFNELLQLGWVNSKETNSILDFFNTKSFIDLDTLTTNNLNKSYFRKSYSFKDDNYSTLSWIRQGEILSNKIYCENWSAESLESAIPSIKKLSRQNSIEKFYPQLQKILSTCGVALVVLAAPTKCKANGFTKFINSEKAIIILSHRYKTDDHFWFTLFHEIGHLIMHSNKALFIDYKTSSIDRNSKIEEYEANLFAQECLIPFDKLNELRKMNGNTRKLLSFASNLDISPGIVVGQMQFHKIIDFKYLNKFKRKYNWEMLINP